MPVGRVADEDGAARGNVSRSKLPTLPQSRLGPPPNSNAYMLPHNPDVVLLGAVEGRVLLRLHAGRPPTRSRGKLTKMEWPMLMRLLPPLLPQSSSVHSKAPGFDPSWLFILLWRLKPSYPPSSG